MKHLLYLILLCFSVIPLNAQEDKLPEGFVYVGSIVPDIILDIRYAGFNNFVGKPVEGYKKPVAILTRPAAQALAKVQAELKKEGYQLKIYDAYRPQRAVNHFVEWAHKHEDTLRKSDFYPQVDKRNLFELGFIASESGHSRGSTVDLTIVDSQTQNELDMGSDYDFFGDISHHNTTKINREQKKNRTLLKRSMIKNGFRPYAQEWWHYTLRQEPYPETYFDFEVK